MRTDVVRPGKDPVRSLVALLCFGLLSSVPAVARAEPVFVPTSSITVTFRMLGIAVNAPFTRFTANIDFDSTKPESASAQFTIDVSSLDLGDPEYTKEVLDVEWFDAVNYPIATFVSNTLKVVSSSELEASGMLTIKGQTVEVRFPVIIRDSGTQRAYDGVVHISRTAFGVGTGQWLKTNVVADDVTISVHAVTDLEDSN